jgi:hypothetical protein
MNNSQPRITVLRSKTVMKSQIEIELIEFLERCAAANPIEVWEADGVPISQIPNFQGTAQKVLRAVPLRDWERKDIGKILGGEPVNIVGIRNSLRAHVVYGLWKRGVAPELLRGVLDFVWDHDYRQMFRHLGLRQIRQIFECAAFPTDHLPEQLTIYHGLASQRGVWPPHSGVSWTLRHDQACWFALHLPGPGGTSMYTLPPDWTPHLLTATVPRRRVAAHLTGRNEDEIIIFGMNRKIASLIGSEADIRAGAEREQQRKPTFDEVIAKLKDEQG